RAHDEDLPVGLEGQPVALVRLTPEIGGDLAAGAEAAVQTAVAAIPGQGEVPTARGPAGAGDHDPAVDVDGDGLGRVVGAGEVRDDLASGAEARVQAAVEGVVAHHGEILAVARAEIDRAGDHDLTIALEGHTRGTTPQTAEGGQNLAPNAEVGVQAAVGVV